ncbi:MAG: ATP-binding cassette domain-containing protein [Alphaproteobacteria bacterium]|nr:ATP-binding cassette domain-containing protein [Alphaproteobacteria bacterium]MDE2162945.1 ATP-binding cassette domain-containing protein [Alphaproteobacteria bacterium]MDE2265221.1 ATP-binding cassette domain-containing protein [Alphaproteobacteria bacterium]
MSDSASLFEIGELRVARPGAAMPELDRFTLTLAAGESVVVLGEAGSGKEALMRVLGGFAERTDVISGTIRFGNGEPRSAAKRLRPTIRIAYLPNPLAHPFAPHATVLSQLCRVIARKLGSPQESAHEELRLALERLEDAPPLSALNKKPAEIDPVVIAWGLLASVSAQTPDLVLADHPFADLGANSVRVLLGCLAAEQKRLGFAVVYATGGLQPATRLGGRVVVIREGRVVEEGDARRLASGHAHTYTRTLYRALPQLSLDPSNARSAARGQPLLQVHGLDLLASPKDKVRQREGLTFELRRGAALALVGEEGSGRRALVRAVLGLDRAPVGRVVFDAVDLNILSQTMTSRLRRRIAFITGADDALDPRMTLWDTVDEPLRAHLDLSSDLVAGYREAALKRVGLASHDGRRAVATLSTFDKRRLQVARAIVGAPLLVVVDEPLRGLDAFAQTIMREVLTDFRTHQEPAFLVITSDFTVAQALADDAMVFSARKVVERGPIVDMLRAPKSPVTRGLIAAVTMPDLSQSPASV